ncbi:MAG: putative toxin-antitoxin system toxin component, PIN family [Candidatus Saccharimonadales bacterium]
MSTSTSPKTAKLRTVFDSNIYVAAALRPGQYADRWLDIAALPGSGLQLFASPYILSEVTNKLVTKFGLPQAIVQQFIQRVNVSARIVVPKYIPMVVPDDPDDNAIVACAIEARAQLIVTADSDLLKLNPYEGIGITHPKELKNIFATEYKKRRL